MLFKVKCIGKFRDEDVTVDKIYPVLHVFDNGNLLISDDNNKLCFGPFHYFRYYKEEEQL